MMDAIASAAVRMSPEQFAVSYSMAIEKNVMETQELAAQELLRMLPTLPPGDGQFIDTYA